MSAEDRRLAADVIRLLSQDAISLQMTFDQAHRNDLEVFQAMVGAAQGCRELEAILSSMGPRRLRVGRYGIETRVVVRRSREKGFEIRLIPFNLGFSLRYGRTESMENKVAVEVSQTPVQE